MTPCDTGSSDRMLKTQRAKLARVIGAAQIIAQRLALAHAAAFEVQAQCALLGPGAGGSHKFDHASILMCTRSTGGVEA